MDVQLVQKDYDDVAESLEYYLTIT